MSDCIEWPGSRGGSNGYGVKKVKGVQRYAHRIAWEEVHGPIPPGMFVCHTCDNPPCVNVAHLFLGTPRDNTQDMLAKGRHSEQRVTHCPQGHEYTEENTYIERQPTRTMRHCKQCMYLRNRAAAQRKREAAR